MVNQLPKRQYISAYQIFYKEQVKVLLQNGIGINMAGPLLQRKWEGLSQEEQGHYEEQFENFEVKYLEQLNEFKKFNEILKQSKKIEKSILKPKKPQIPQIHYVIENRYKYDGKQFSQTQIYLELIQEYNFQRLEVKKQLELEYENKQLIYNDEMMILLKKNCERYINLKEKLQLILQQEAQEFECDAHEYQQKKIAVDFNVHNKEIERKVKLSGNKCNQINILQSGNNQKEFDLKSMKEPQLEKIM